jgi:hypothetical protein
MEAAVLGHLLSLHPVHTTQDEVVRELSNASNEFADRDRVENAIGEVVRIGLAHRHGNFVIPSRALIYVDGLDY